MRILAVINPPDEIRKILACLRLPTKALSIVPPYQVATRQPYGEMSG